MLLSKKIACVLACVGLMGFEAQAGRFVGRASTRDAVTHPTTVRNGLADFVVDQLDGGTLEFQTAGGVEVATLTFGAPAFGAAASGIATANAITKDTAATGGTIAKAVLKTSGGVATVNCSVTAAGGGGDIELNSVVISAGQEVSLTSLTYEAAP